MTIIEAGLLALVALLAAWSGYASAKWSTESRLDLAGASTARVEANRADGEESETLRLRLLDVRRLVHRLRGGQQEAMAIAERRFRPEFDVRSRRGSRRTRRPTLMRPRAPRTCPSTSSPDGEAAERLDAEGGRALRGGCERRREWPTDYVRITVFLATVLFLVGISGHFRVPGGALRAGRAEHRHPRVALVLLISSPLPPA